MKGNCRKAFAALVLVLVFSSAAFADDGVILPGITSPPPPQPAATDGIMWPGITSQVPPATTAALTLIQIVLSLP